MSDPTTKTERYWALRIGKRPNHDPCLMTDLDGLPVLYGRREYAVEARRDDYATAVRVVITYPSGQRKAVPRGK